MATTDPTGGDPVLGFAGGDPWRRMFLLGGLSAATLAIAIFAVAASAVFFIAAFALPETRVRHAN